MKDCKDCKKSLQFSSFGKNPRSADGLEYSCRDCKNARLRAYRKINPQWTIKMRRKHYVNSCNKEHIRLKRVWGLMQMRCNDPKNYQYFRYGGRGIKIQWDSFASFMKDMMPTYNPNLTIERINNDGDYAKENCRWATHIEQSNNTRRNVFYQFNDEKVTLAQIARKYNINYKMLWKRVRLYNLTIEESIKKGCKYADAI